MSNVITKLSGIYKTGVSKVKSSRDFKRTKQSLKGIKRKTKGTKRAKRIRKGIDKAFG